MSLIHQATCVAIGGRAILIEGPPGIGKTHFAREVAHLLGTGMGFLSMSSMTAGWLLSGSSSQWMGLTPAPVGARG